LKKKLTNLKSNLHNQDNQKALEILTGINLDSLQTDIQKFESYEDGFRSILFDETGIHAEKEKLDSYIKKEIMALENLDKENLNLDDYIQQQQNEIEKDTSLLTELEKNLSRYQNDATWLKKQIESLQGQIKDTKNQINSYQEDIIRVGEDSKRLKSEIEEWSHNSIKFNEDSRSLLEKISTYRDKRSELEKKISERKLLSKKDEENLREITDKIVALDKELLELKFKENNIEDYLWTEYEKKVADFTSEDVKENQSNLPTYKLKELKDQIKNLGPINNLALKEYEDLKVRFEYYDNQRNDIIKAKEDILEVIKDLDTTSIEMFLNTFEKVKVNFAEIFKKLFEGGEAKVELADPENILESGIDINVRPPGKKNKSINLLSGGEKALTAIALLFATYKVKPSPFCFLDEIDAPLDEENIGRFVKLLKDFAKDSQFILVTHNKKTMSIGEAIYGITMQDPGISSILSVKMEKAFNEA